MPVHAGRLGFWFRPQDRAQIIKDPPDTIPDVLVFYDPLTNKQGNTNYYFTILDYYGGTDVQPVRDVWPVIKAREEALGFRVTLIQSYEQLPNDLSKYVHIWDIGYASPYVGHPFNPTTKLSNYLKQGGAMFLLGENVAFGNRDDAIEVFVTAMGGGNITTYDADFAYYTNITSTVQPEFLLANNSNSITFGAPNVFTNWGTGTPIATAGTTLPTAVCWKTGSLSNARAGAIVSVLDINFFGGSFAPAYYNPNFIANLSIIMNKK